MVSQAMLCYLMQNTSWHLYYSEEETTAEREANGQHYTMKWELGFQRPVRLNVCAHMHTCAYMKKTEKNGEKRGMFS